MWKDSLTARTVCPRLVSRATSLTGCQLDFFFGGERGEGVSKNGVGSLHRLIEHRFPDGCIHTSTSDSDEASSSNRDEFQ